MNTAESMDRDYGGEPICDTSFAEAEKKFDVAKAETAMAA